MRIAICDDNGCHINSLEQCLHDVGEENGVKIDCDVYQSGEQLMSAYKDKSEIYDALFIDIELGSMSGIEVAKVIREIDECVEIVFVTGYSEYAKECFECSPATFVTKPINLTKTSKALKTVYKRLAKKRCFFAIAKDNLRIRINCDDVIYCESQNHSVNINTCRGVYRIRKSLSDFLNEVDSGDFCRVHRSFAVNLMYLDKIEKETITLSYGEKNIPISRTYKKNLMVEFDRYNKRKLIYEN